MIGIGIVIFTVGIISFLSSRSNRNWQKISGTITDMEQGGPLSDIPVYAPIVQYEVNKEKYSVTGSVYVSSKPKIGSAITIAVDPTNHKNAKVVQSETILDITWALLVLGPIISLIGIAFFKILT